MKTLLPLFLMLLCSFRFAAAEGRAVDYSVGDQPYEGWMTSPGPNAPLVVILHDWDGLTDYEIKRGEMLTEEGYAVFAADLFGKGVRPTEVKDKRQHTGELYQNREKLRALIQGAVEEAGKQGLNTDSMVVMGYCFGGAAALEGARAGLPAAGFVTFHGGLSTPEGQDYSKTKSEILVLHGTADSIISMEDVARLGTELETHKVSHELISYGGARHSFTVFGSDRYHEGADQKSWSRFLGFLARVAPVSTRK